MGAGESGRRAVEPGPIKMRWDGRWERGSKEKIDNKCESDVKTNHRSATRGDIFQEAKIKNYAKV
jgi:hypothetical protein